MKTLRFLCFASLFAALIICLAGRGDIGLADLADPVGVSMPSEESLGQEKPPTPVDLAGSTAPENCHDLEPSGNKSSGTIMITMTGIVGDPGDIGG